MKTKNYLKADEYLQQLKSMYRSYFDLQENKEIAGRNFDLYAFSHIQNEKYFASKKIKIWEYAKYEHCLIKNITSKSNELIPDKNFLNKTIDELVELHRNHKQSYITIVNISEKSLSNKEIEKIQNFSFSKSFLLGFRGWCDIRLITVDLQNNKVYVNKKAQKVKDNYHPERFLNAKTS